LIKKQIKKEDSSFRDNQGNIFYLDNKVLRGINKNGKKNFEFIYNKKILEDSIKSNYLISTKLINKDHLPDFFSNFEYIVESEVIPFISYPYEWSFEQLKKAALHHLDFQIFLFHKGAVLRDSSAYNIQFIGTKPYFIDLLSIKQYEYGEYWIGYKQFCENFLNPLLLGSLKGVHHNNWFRGNLEGIATTELNKLLSFKDKISFKIFTHIHLQAKLNIKSIENEKKISSKYHNLKKLSKTSYISIIVQLRNWISELTFKDESSIWQNYSKENTYDNLEYNQKKKIVGDFIKKTKPNTLIDLGCNDGDYSKLSLDSGAKYVVGFDFDHNTIANAFKMAKDDEDNFLPLILDASNPSPNQGWLQKERKGFIERFHADALIALAFEHHLIIGKNVPIQQFVEWITSISECGLIEFVPKTDKTIQKMLEYRDDIFSNYTEEEFENCLKEKSNIINKNTITKSGRIIYEYKIN
jgi:ribosomal protein L11 methylase PrmA